MSTLKTKLKDICLPNLKTDDVMPIWLLNEKLEHSTIDAQLSSMKEQEITNIVLKAERGIIPSYMSTDFLQYLDYIFCSAKKKGISIYFCDDLQNAHPGAYAGITEKRAELRLNYLSLSEIVKTKGPSKHIQELSPSSQWLVIGFRMKEKNIDIASAKNLTVQIKQNTFSWTIPAGDWRILFFQLTPCKRPVGGWVLNTMDSEAAKAYMNISYEAVRNALSKEAITAFKGLLVELPYVGPDASIRGLPWSEDISKQLTRSCKANILSQVMALFVEGGSKDAGKVRREYYSLLLKLQCQNFLKPIQEYCSKKKLVLRAFTASSDPYSGEGQLRYDYTPIVQKCTAIEGLSSADTTIADTAAGKLFADFRGYYNKSRGTAILGRNRSGIGLGLKDLKYEADELALNGIEGRIIDGNYYALRYQGGMRAPSNAFIHTPAFSQYGTMLKAFERRMKSLVDLHAHEKVGVMFPGESFYASYNPIATSVYKMKTQHFDDLITYLTKENISYQFINEALAGTMTISNENELVLSIGGKTKASFSTMIIPEAAIIPKKFVAILEKFIQGGGKVVFYGVTPFETIEGIKDAHLIRPIEYLQSKMPGSVFKLTKPEELESLRTGCFSNLPQRVEFFSETQMEKRISCRTFSDKGVAVHLMLNTSNDNVRTEIKVNTAPKTWLYWFDLSRGVLNTLPSSESNGTVKPFIYSFAPKEGGMLLESDVKLVSQPNPCLALDDPSRLYRIILKDQWEYDVLDDNALPITVWSMKINSNRDVNSGYNTAYESYINVDSVPTKSFLFLNNLINRHINGFGSGFFPIEIAFNGVQIKHMQFFNRGEKTYHAGDILKDSSYAGINSFAADVTANVKKGLNRIIVKTYGSTFSPMAIKYPVLFVGKFAVKKSNNGWLLTENQESIKSGSWTDQGFPFFCGRIVYRQIFEKPDAFKRVMLRFKQIENMAVVRVNGNEVPLPPWQPQSIDISKFIQGEKNKIEIEVSNLHNNLLKMVESPAGLVGEVYVDVYQ
jgi:hypothetical protein